MKKEVKEIVRRNSVKCFLSDKEMRKVTQLRLELGSTMSNLIRNRLLHPDMLNVNPSKLLLVFSEIGSNVATIKAGLERCFEGGNILKIKDFDQLKAVIKDYLDQQHKLELQIRKLLIRIELKE